MGSLKKSEFLGAMGKAFQIFKAVVDAILARGGDDEDVARMEQMAGEIADLVMAAKQPTASMEQEPVETKPAPLVPGWPAIGEEFELTLDGDAPENQPLEMVRSDGYTGKWKFTGRGISGRRIRRFKLVAIGYCRDFDEVKQKLAEYGENEGQWRQAFKARYRGGCGRPIGVADDSWVSPDGGTHFPYVHGLGRSHFRWTGFDFRDYWLWLVPCKQVGARNLGDS